METQSLVQCPVCNKRCKPSSINEHVNKCLNTDHDETKTNDKPPVNVKKRKSDSPPSGLGGWGFMMKMENSNNSKRSKPNLTAESDTVNNSDNENDIIEIIDPASSVENESRQTIDDKSSLIHKKKTLLKEINIDSDETDSKLHLSKNDTINLSKKEIKHTKDEVKITKEKLKWSDISKPLAEQMRPSTFESYIGQDVAVGDKSLLLSLLQSDHVPSMILWGPPGCGKTTLARIIASRSKGKSKFVQLSATSSGVNDVKEVVKQAKNNIKMFKMRTILFLDEVHRFNKTQQDSLLPHVEDGTLILIGATTENPSFQVNNALLSRCRVIVLEKLDSEAIYKILMNAVDQLGFQVFDLEDDIHHGNKDKGQDSSAIWIEKLALQMLSKLCDGDARIALNGLQMTVQSQVAKSGQSQSGLQNKDVNRNKDKADVIIRSEHVKQALQKSHIAYDKTGEEHYNIISALHKSMRGSDDSAALYWLARMLEGGETPLFVARRLVSFASEDIGLADPQALILSVSTFQACHSLGMPECEKVLAECVVYLSRAPKSVEVFSAYNKAKACVHNHEGPLPSVPLHLRNASTKLMKQMGYGKGYKYNPDYKEPVQQDYLPKSLLGTNFFK